MKTRWFGWSAVGMILFSTNILASEVTTAQSYDCGIFRGFQAGIATIGTTFDSYVNTNVFLDANGWSAAWIALDSATQKAIDMSNALKATMRTTKGTEMLRRVTEMLNHRPDGGTGNVDFWKEKYYKLLDLNQFTLTTVDDWTKELCDGIHFKAR